MKVFLSSTYIDLIKHRKEAAEALTRLGHYVIGMETFNARTEDPTKASLKEVEKCELFVGIYAHRYGSQIGKSKVSVTEQEFDYAVKQGKEIFAFFIDGDFPWPPKMVDKDAGKIQKLEDFKSKVVNHATPDYFTDERDLAYKIIAAVRTHAGILAPKLSQSTLPYQPKFFGRDKELAIITDAISPESRTWGALIDGPGGIGKTALAIRAATLASKELFERKIFISAKVRELTPEGEKPIRDFSRSNYFSMLNELALELGDEGIQRLVPDERADQLRMALTGRKALLIFDNLETLHPDERDRLFQFLSRLPEGNKAIVTSRRRADVDARVIRLDRLSADEALQLIEELAKNNSRLDREDERARRDLYEITNGNPLLIKWVCGQLGREGSSMSTIAQACIFIDNAPRGNNPLDYIFGDLLETFTENETRVLAALSHFEEYISLPAIAYLTGIPEKSAETTVEDLTGRSILITNNEERSFLLPPLAAQFVRKKLTNIVNNISIFLANESYNIIRRYGQYSGRGFAIIDNMLPMIIAAFPQIRKSKNSHFQVFTSHFVSYLQYTGRWDDLIAINEIAEQKAVEENDFYHAGERAFTAAFFYARREQISEAIACADRMEQHWQNPDKSQQANIIRIRALISALNRNYKDAFIYTEKSLALWRDLKNQVQIGIMLVDLAELSIETGDLDEAEKFANEGLQIARRMKYKQGITNRIGLLADIALKREKWVEAKNLARKSLRLSEEIGELEYIAANHYRIAKAYFSLGYISKGLPYVQYAVEVFSYLLVQKELKRAQDLLAQYEVTIQNKEKNRKRKGIVRVL